MGQLQSSTFHADPVGVSAGEMNNDIKTIVMHLITKGIRAESRISSRIVGYRNSCYTAILI